MSGVVLHGTRPSVATLSAFGGPSHFVKVHDAKFLKAKKRIYMTATPRLYGDEAKGKAKDSDAVLCSMDDASLFGEELHRLGFGEAVGKNLLSDYKVLVLAVDEKYVSRAFQRQIADANNEINLDDAVRITGCWNGLAKKFESATAAATDLQGDVAPMRRAVAFSRSIKDSKAFVEKFVQIVAAYRESHPDADDRVGDRAEHAQVPQQPRRVREFRGVLPSADARRGPSGGLRRPLQPGADQRAGLHQLEGPAAPRPRR